MVKYGLDADLDRCSNPPPRDKVCKIFDAVRKKLMPKLPAEDKEVLKRAHLLYCPLAEMDHRRRVRQFAHTYHPGFQFIICTCKAINRIAPENILGIIVHEIGHLLGGRPEDEADMYIANVLHAPIKYMGDERMEYLHPSEVGFSPREWDSLVTGRR